MGHLRQPHGRLGQVPGGRGAPSFRLANTPVPGDEAIGFAEYGRDAARQPMLSGTRRRPVAALKPTTQESVSPPSEGCRQAASPRHDLQRFDPQRSRLTDNENAARVIRDWRHFPHRVRRNRHGRRVSPLVLAAINHLLRRAGWLPPAGAHLMQRSNRGRPLRHSGCPFGLVHPVRTIVSDSRGARIESGRPN